MTNTAENKVKRLRTCIGCGQQSSKTEFLRIVRSSDGSVSFDAKGKAAGRGAYVCSPACFEAACKKNKLDRALKVTLTNDDYERVAAEIAAYTDNERASKDVVNG